MGDQWSYVAEIDDEDAATVAAKQAAQAREGGAWPGG
jgi:hypothetical protein